MFDLSLCFQLAVVLGTLAFFHYWAYRFLMHSEEEAIQGYHQLDYWRWLRRGMPGKFEPEGDTSRNQPIVQLMGLYLAVFMACIDLSICANIVAPFVWRALGIK